MATGKGFWLNYLYHLSPSGSFNLDSLWKIEYSFRVSERRQRKLQAYCFKCRKKVEVKNPQKVTLKNKRPATQGVCPVCETKVFRIGQG